MADEVRKKVQSKLSKVCQDSLYCDISSLETVCSDILADEATLGQDMSRRKRREAAKKKQQKIQILFNVVGKYFLEIVRAHSGQDLGDM